MSGTFEDDVYKSVFEISRGRIDLLDESTRDLLNASQESHRRKPDSSGNDEDNRSKEAA